MFPQQDNSQCRSYFNFRKNDWDLLEQDPTGRRIFDDIVGQSIKSVFLRLWVEPKSQAAKDCVEKHVSNWKKEVDTPGTNWNRIWLDWSKKFQEGLNRRKNDGYTQSCEDM